jgi:septal ring factor EnvC (AmiA/AmiB activator)
MLELISRTKRSVLIGSALVFAAVVGWGSFAYSALSSQGRVSSVTAERDAALAQRDRLQQAAGELAQVEARLSSARVEYSRVVQGWAEAKARAGVVQQELATLTKRLDQAKDRVSQTGSIRQAEPPQRPARKP